MITILSEQTLIFAYDSSYGAFANHSNPSLFVPVEGQKYLVKWDGQEYESVAFTHENFPGMVLMGNTLIIGGENTGEPYALCSTVSGSGMSLYALDTSTTHTMAVYVNEDGIVLKDRDGNDVTHNGVNVIRLKKTNGELQSFIPGIPSQKTVDLNFTDGDMIVKPDDGTVLTEVTITTPENLDPSNIVEGVEIAGIVGNKKIIELLDTEEVTPDFSNGDQTVTAPDGYGIKTVVISKPDTLKPGNIAEGVNIAGVVGTFAGGGGDSFPIIDDEWLEKICFWDIDGTMIYSCTISEASTLESLPDPPEHEGLTFQGWNYTLDEIKNANHILDIGAVYIPTDGKTHAFIDITNSSYKAFPVCFKQTIANGVTVDWGDGATSSSSSTGNVSLTHTYSEIGEYEITFTVADGCTMTLGQGSSSTTFLGKGTSNYRNYVQKLHIGNNVIMGAYGIYNNQYLEYLTIPNGIETIDQYGIVYAIYMYALILPKTLKTIGNYGINNVCGQTSIISHFPISIPIGVTEIGNYNFTSGNTNRLVLPDSLLSVGSYSFSGVQSCLKIYIPDEIQTLSDYAFRNAYFLRKCLHIPSGLTSLPSNFMYNHRCIKEVIYPEGIENIGNYNLYGCYGVEKVVLPESLKTIGSSFLSNCYNVKTMIIKSSLESCSTTSFSSSYIEEYIFTNPIPSSAFASQFNTVKCTIYVPDEAIEDYKTVITSTYRRYIKPLSEYKGEIP